MFLDIALLWEPVGYTTSTRRAPVLDAHKNPCLPSWSWVGWEGEISIRNWNAGCCYIKKPGHRPVSGTSSWHRVAPILQWSVSDGLKSVRKRINSSWQQYIQCHWDDSLPLPPGWTRHRYGRYLDYSWVTDFCKPPVRHPGDVSYFTHESCPNTEFWFPIPISREEIYPSICPVARYLHCKTQRTWIWRGKSYKFADGFTDHTSILLNEENGEWAGFLHLHIDKVDDYITASNTQVELIALSKGFAEPDTGFPENSEAFEKFEAEGRYNFYNVMWIEWQNGIAYRKAIGRVLETTWEQQELEWIDITLG